MKKTANLTMISMILLLLIGMLSVALNIQPVRASGTIYIRADGSIDPPDAPILTVDSITYTFADSIYDSIVVERDNIVVDGAGYTVQRTGAYGSDGIYLSGRNNVTIRNVCVKKFYYGIYLYSSSDNSIFGNNITDNNYGIGLTDFSNYNSIFGNNITDNNWDGIQLYYSSNYNSIFGNNITANNEYGIYLYSSANNNISRNNITDNNYGILLIRSSNNSITGNEFFDGGLDVWSSYQNIVEDNTVNGNPLVYFENVSNLRVYDAGQVILVNCSSILIENLTLSKASFGVELWETKNSTITRNNITNNRCGIYLYSSANNSMSGNNITNNSDGIGLRYSLSNSIKGNNVTSNDSVGIDLYSSANNSMSGNNITNNSDGIGLRYSLSNSIKGNNITNNWYGIDFWNSSSNTISGNNITSNNGCGIALGMSSDNSIYHNNFMNNTQQVYDVSWSSPLVSSSINTWDDSYPSGGNYWSDYADVDSYSEPYQNETGSDGIWDHPYVIDGNNKDNYPLVSPYWYWSNPIPGDINKDMKVDANDLISAAKALGSYSGHPRWNPLADINHDDKVNVKDIVSIARNFGKTYT